jgi:hypothetical protein
MQAGFEFRARVSYFIVQRFTLALSAIFLLAGCSRTRETRVVGDPNWLAGETRPCIMHDVSYLECGYSDEQGYFKPSSTKQVHTFSVTFSKEPTGNLSVWECMSKESSISCKEM